MSKTKHALDNVSIFSTLTSDERARVRSLAKERSYQEGSTVYKEGEQGESLFIIEKGAVELQTIISEGIEKTLLTVREGSLFGLVELIEPQARAVTAKAIQPTKLLEIARPVLADFVISEPETGMKVLFALSVGLARQMHIAVDVLRQNLAWTLDVSGAAALNLHQLVTDSARITLELTNGKPVTGQLLKIESSDAGHELLVKAENGTFSLIPYHAIVRLSFAHADVDLTPESPEML